VLYDIGAIFVAGLLFLVPGLALLMWLLPDLDQDWFGWLSLAAGLSLALLPLSLLWTRTLGGFHWGPLALWLILGMGTLLIVWRLISRPKLLHAVKHTPRGFSLLLIVVALSVVGLRLWTIRGLNIPLWADSYQHTMMAQLIVDNGGLFDSWLPYAPLKSFTYHYGFHATVAFFHWLTGMDTPRSVLIVGQLLNALAAFTIYPLAVRLTGNRWVGLVAVLTAAILSPMPGFYVNWGRYTQLAGQVILPVALWFTWEMADYPRLDWKRLSPAVLTVAGLALTHYRVILLYAAIVPAWWLVYSAFNKDRRSEWLTSLERLALLGGLALLVICPWLAHVVSSRLARQQVSIATRGQENDFIRNEYNRFHDIRKFMPTPMLAAIGVGFLVSFVRKRALAFFVGLWATFLFLLANPYLLNLPGTGVVNNFAVLISLYIPGAIMVGYGAVSVAQYGRRYWQGIPWVFGLLVVGASLWAAQIQVNMVDRTQFMLVTPTDERAMVWIKANTSPDAKFLVNAYFGYGGSSVLGTDGGWWIPLLTGRKNTVPPLTYTSETAILSDYRQQVYDLVAEVQASDLSTPEGLALLKRNGITHIYIGQQEGRVGNPGAPLLSAEVLAASPYYESVYFEDRVRIFKVHADLAEEGK